MRKIGTKGVEMKAMFGLIENKRNKKERKRKEKKEKKILLLFGLKKQKYKINK